MLGHTWAASLAGMPRACRVPTDGSIDGWVPKFCRMQLLRRERETESGLMQRPNRRRLRKPSVYLIVRMYFSWLVCTRNPSRQKFICRNKGGCACPMKLFCRFYFSASPSSSLGFDKLYASRFTWAGKNKRPHLAVSLPCAKLELSSQWQPLASHPLGG